MGERMAMLERHVTSDTATPGQLMPGTGLCNLEDTVTLTCYAAEIGCVAAMVPSIPPATGGYIATTAK